MTDPDGRRPILRLDETTVRRIAAGEVVERPASVVKELVENSVDAGATEVRVRLEGGGLEAIVVDDDGSGILREELPLAVERHATSKLTRLEELKAVATLGFRGEALAAIGSVAHLRIVSRPPGREAADGLSLVAGQVVGSFVHARAPGTTVEVRDLFFNTPARRKFLHAPAAEQVEVVDIVDRLYLARPSVGLTLSNEHGELARYPPAASRRDAAARVFGPEFLRQAFEVRSGLGTALAVRGVLARPGLSRSNSLGLYLSVNGRVVHARPLVQAIRQAYTDYLPRTRYPVGAIDLEIDPARVDVNVHPTKREVRIARELEVADELRHVVRAALLSTPQVSDAVGAAPSEPPEPPDAGVPSVGPTAAGGRTAGFRAVQRTIGDAPVAARVAASAHHPALRLVGPVFDLYWIAESDGSLVLVDQHAASERVLYEELRREGRLARQELVEPVRLDLSALRAKVLEAHADVVRRAG
ncbi:MAG TPA: DNA mismatch repair endonuclease MutL, partial [Thermoplasmata archaeon]